MSVYESNLATIIVDVGSGIIDRGYNLDEV